MVGPTTVESWFIGSIYLVRYDLTIDCSITGIKPTNKLVGSWFNSLNQPIRSDFQNIDIRDTLLN